MYSTWINEVLVFLLLNALLSHHLHKAKTSGGSNKEKSSKSTKETESKSSKEKGNSHL
jgi:hypothetical protein